MKHILGALGVTLLFVSTSCNIERKIEKNQEAFDKIGRKWLDLHPCSNDSTFVYVPGKKDSIPFLVPVLTKDTAEIKRQIDSIYKANQKDDIQTIKSAYNSGYDKAEKIWKNKLAQIKIPLPVVDTLRITLKDRQQITLLKSDLESLKLKLSDCQLTGEKVKGKSDKWFLLFIIACCFLIASIYFNIRKL